MPTLLLTKSLLAVAAGGAIGSVLRWLIAIRYNTPGATLPLGTWLVNFIGGFIIGAATAWLMKQPHIDAHWRIFIISGFCGGLTTFSTFSLEIMLLLQSEKYLSAFIGVGAHVLGSLLATCAGYLLVTRWV